MAHRYVVIVPRGAPETFAYLSRSLKDVADVQVVVDRRDARATTPPPATDRRARRAPRDSREAFGCTLVRIAATPEEPDAPAPVPHVLFRAVTELRGA